MVSINHSFSTVRRKDIPREAQANINISPSLALVIDAWVLKINTNYLSQVNHQNWLRLNQVYI